MILLDTCIISETIKPEPNQRVLTWLDTVEEEALYLSVISLGELYRGIELLPEGEKQTALFIWFEELRERFTGRILDIDGETMITWARLSAGLKKSGEPMPLMDSLISACALRYGALLATRNTRDYKRTGMPLFDPWTYGESE